MFCPVTGEPMLVNGSPSAATVRGVWFDEAMDAPEIVDAELQQAWDEFVETVEAEERDDDEPDAFFLQLRRAGWVTFEVTNTESDTPGRMWVVVDIEAELDAEAADDDGAMLE